VNKKSLERNVKMIHPMVVKAINYLPTPVIKSIANRLINKYLNKYANITVENQEVLDKIKGPVIIVGNHLSNSDALILNRVTKKLDPYFVAGVKLTNNSLSRIGYVAFKTIQIQPNSADIEAMKKCIERVKNGNSIFIFPEGTRSRNGALMEARKGVILIAKKCGVPILPIGMAGTEKLMPINTDDMGKESFHNADVHVNIGEPFYLPEKEKGEDKDTYNDKCMNTIMKNIAVLLPEKYRGVYK
jgi:1-acyl-sn-glycerol-3-phosphate acyltransferase